MSKNVLREIIILLLLTLAIILLLGVLLYEYVPMNKVIPETVTYTATDETRKAIEEQSAQDDGTVVLSYEVTSTDLKNYKKVNDYKAGRKTQEQQKIIVVQQIVTMKTIVLQIIKQTEQTQIM